ncbi:gas vesicle protein GvpH [Natronorubrum thiooxidans]|uniref:GvpH protein n=1 Tax=Natronorubrum thiooxidans TaxID=308853 RepID=A0A1N7E0E3_9EURY|nr:gas vesicle protein GvpH [Natronorubrum thiooxidans]SIR81544.1 GvpH protein [Natronorubrum thiooxidans]
MPPTDPERDDTSDESADETHWLSNLFTALQWLDDSTSGRRDDRTRFDYDVSIRTGISSDDDPQFERRPFSREESARGREREHSRSRTRRDRSDAPSVTPSSDHHLTTREFEDELLVIADVAGANPDDVTVGFGDDATLVVAVSDRELGRLEVPWRDWTADAVITNGVLTVRVRPDPTATGTNEQEGDE